MWSPKDLNWDSKDIPCNTQIYFRVRDSKLDMTVTCRSNDMLWGAYGTNCVHFAFLQEYIAAMTELDIGSLYQYSNNFHAYVDVFDPLIKNQERWTDFDDLYGTKNHEPQKLVNEPESFMEELQECISAIRDNSDDIVLFKNRFLTNALVMAKAWFNRRSLTAPELANFVSMMPAKDWRAATYSYIHRNCKLAKEQE
jgi:hypothetical protein